MRIPLTTLVALILLPAAALGGEAPRPEVVSHAVEVALDPAKGGIEATDRITVRRNGGGDLALDLRADLSIRLLEVDGRTQERIVREPSDPRPGTARYRVPVLPGRDDASVVLSFGGAIREEVKKADDLAFVVGDASNGHISEKGVYLGEGIGWVPLDGSMATFSIRASVPEGWTVASQGGVPSEETKDGRTVVSFPPGIPYDALWLQAGKWKVERRTTKSGVSIATYLTEANAGQSALILDSVEEYLGLYAGVLGPYPHAKFDVVENFFTTGYGMPTATLLGGDVVQHMGMMAQRSGGKIPAGYLDHELVHCWWGNGVFVDYDTGNWCEALTTYCSNYLRKEWESPEEAAKHRRGVRSRFAARVSPAKDYPLRKFTGKTEDFENDIGYGKGSMVFHAVRRAVGDEAFFGALRDVVAAFTGKRASWDDFRKAFEKRSGRNLEALFAQFLDRTGAPVVVLRDCAAAPSAGGWTVTGKVVQQGEPWAMAIPLVVETGGDPVSTTIDLSQPETPFVVRTERIPTRVLLDPDSHAWRGYAPSEAPPMLDATVHDGAGFEVWTPAEAGEPFAPILDAVKERAASVVRFGGVPPFDRLPAPQGSRSVLFLGHLNHDLGIRDFLDLARSPVRYETRTVRVGGSRFEGDDIAVLVSGRHPANRDRFYTVYAGKSDASLAAARRLFFYGGDGVVVFKAGIPVLRLEPEGDESSRAALLGSFLPGADPEWIKNKVEELCSPQADGRLAGRKSEEYARAGIKYGWSGAVGDPALASWEQDFHVQVMDWDRTPCFSDEDSEWERGIPFCFSAPCDEWRTPTRIGVGEGSTLEGLFADLRAAQDAGAQGVFVHGPPEPPVFLKDYLVHPSTLPEKEIGRSSSAEMAVMGKRSRLLMPDFEVKVPVVYLVQPPERSALPARMRAPLKRHILQTANLFAMVPGGDPSLEGEAVLLGAHLDHLGTGYPGADDDASGVAAVVAAGEILLANRKSLRRPVVLALFGAEEWGLRGSRYFVAHRPEGIPPVVMGLTLDTVGAKDAPEVSVVGETFYPKLAAVMARCLEGAGLRKGPDIDKHAFAHGSDHYALHEAGIPAIDLWSGSYARMHTKDDTPDRVDPRKIARIARAAAAWAIEMSRSGPSR